MCSERVCSWWSTQHFDESSCLLFQQCTHTTAPSPLSCRHATTLSALMTVPTRLLEIKRVAMTVSHVRPMMPNEEFASVLVAQKNDGTVFFQRHDSFHDTDCATDGCGGSRWSRWRRRIRRPGKIFRDLGQFSCEDSTWSEWAPLEFSFIVKESDADLLRAWGLVGR